MNDRPLVSLLLPNKNNEPVLDLFFERLAANTTYPSYELIVVDDGSTDRGVEMLRRWRDSGRFPRFELIEREPSGVVRTLNAGLERARGEVVARLDGDATIETPGWLEKMAGFLLSDERVGVVVPKVVFDDGRVQGFGLNLIGPAGAHDRGTRITEPVGRRTLDVAVERPLEHEAEGGDEIAEVDAGIGACMVFRRALAEELGGFDTAYDPVLLEDYDFALGARRLGRKVFYLPDVRVVHRHSLRNPRGDRALEYWLWRARRRFGDAFPLWLRRRVAAAAKIGDHDPERIAMFQRHYEVWRRKWGFDPVNPDMEEVIRRYGGTEVCWAYDEERREAGRRIAAAYRSNAPRPAAAP